MDYKQCAAHVVRRYIVLTTTFLARDFAVIYRIFAVERFQVLALCLPT